MDIETFIMTIIPIAMIIYFTAFILYTVRIFRGPTLPDMVIAIDALSYDLAAFLVILSILIKSPILIPCAFVIALWIYALDIYVAKYLEAREMGD